MYWWSPFSVEPSLICVKFSNVEVFPCFQNIGVTTFDTLNCTARKI